MIDCGMKAGITIGIPVPISFSPTVDHHMPGIFISNTPSELI